MIEDAPRLICYIVSVWQTSARWLDIHVPISRAEYLLVG